MELELDDDVFFADISKQISLLIMDEDEQLNPVSLSSSSPLAFQSMFRGSYQTAPYMYHQEQSKGTGVFIPKSSQTRRRPHHPKQGRVNSFNAKQQHSLHQNRQQYQQNHDNLRRTLTTHNNNNKSSMVTSNVHASIPRRTYRDAASIYS
ncbi:hypothetical protein F2Q68_00022369 [Brassica cretica]|uniref:Uncharacterized protein n=2 Tax=Brassica TaxID=3705 RepID=A0A0D3EE40_BRAOL|nr:PREDICTED: uncharacterized protein LOC106315772 [Brassica oleracea var. oleracea]KAF2535443.1 hypothetical protein F2Q68_00022369 [Brassica cretica]